MRKEEIVQNTQYSYYCDICGEEGKSHCVMCKRDLCCKHIKYDDRQYGDYPDKYCISCWEIGEDYREEMRKVQEKADEKIDKINEEWKKKALGSV